jgi:hypothetical protein
MANDSFRCLFHSWKFTSCFFLNCYFLRIVSYPSPPVWAAQAGAKRVYAIEYTDMANHARRVVKANGVEHIVTVIQGAVEDVILPQEDWDGIGIDGGLGLGGLTLEEGDVEVNDDGRRNQRVVDIILSGECVPVCFFFLSTAAILPTIAPAELPTIARDMMYHNLLFEMGTIPPTMTIALT